MTSIGLRRTVLCQWLALLAALCMLDPLVSFAAGEGLIDFYAELSLLMPSMRAVVVCHGVGCRYRTEVPLTSGDRARLGMIMAKGRASPVAERRALAEAVAWFDRRVGPAAGTNHRIARAGAHESGDRGQMDCIDTTSNNTSLLLLLEQLKLLHHHRVDKPVSRGVFLDGRLPHTTAVIAERIGGRPWAIDNWTHAYGELPDVKPLEQWQADD